MVYLGENEPTPSEIRASHKKAVGGKRDRCSKGKSCSAACIERNDRCLVDFPEPASRVTSRVRDKVSQLELFPTERYVDKNVVRDIKNFEKEMERKLIKAVHLDDEGSYNRYRQSYIDLRQRLGGRMPPSLKVPATWDRLQNVKKSYEKAKSKVVARMEKAAGRGDRKKYQEEEQRLLRIRRDLGVKVGDTAKYLRNEIWYRKGGGLIEARSKKTEKDKGMSDLQQINRLYVRQAFSAIREGNLTGYKYAVDRIAKLKDKVAQSGETFKVVNPPNVATAKKMIDKYDQKFAALLKKVEKDAASGKIGAANKGVEALYKLHVNEGVKMGAGSFPTDRVEFARRGGNLNPLPTTTRAYPLRDKAEFEDVMRWTRSISRDFHDRFAKILDMKNYYGGEERDKIMDRLKISDSTFAKAISSIRRYTGTYYEIIKDAHRLLESGKSLSELSTKYRQALAVEKSINRFISAFPKEEIPKFRGGRMSDDRLADLISSAKAKGEFRARGITSWSSDLSVAQKFADDPPGSTKGKPNRVILQTVNKLGIPIESITEVDNEMELLTSGRARYVHTGRYNRVSYGGETYHFFEVIER